MKHFFFSIAAIFLFAANNQAQVIGEQDQTATFKDGTTIKYKLLSNVGDDQFINSIVLSSLADFRNESGGVLMYERYDAEHYFAMGEIGFGLDAGFDGINFGGTYFLGASDKNYKLPFSVRTVASGYNEQTKYILKTDAIKNRHFGINAEAGYEKYYEGTSEFDYHERYYQISKLTSGEIAIGFGYVATKQALLQVDGKTYMGGSHLFHLTADLLFQPGIKFDYSALDSASAAAPLNTQQITNGGIGFRFMLQGQTSLKFNKKNIPNRNAGYFYRIGIEKASYVSPSSVRPFESMQSVCIIFGFGAFWSFGS